MARLFDDADNELLLIDSAVVTSGPFTFACWFYADDVANLGTLMGAGRLNANERYHIFVRGDSGGDPIEFQVRDSGGTSVATSTTGITVDTWHHAIATENTDGSEHDIYLDNGSNAQNTTTRTPASIGGFSVGAARYGNPGIGNFFYHSGGIAEVGVWNVVINAGERAALAAGASPLLVRPASLVDYWRIIRVGATSDSEISRIVGGTALAPVSNSSDPVVIPHPPKIIYPAPTFISYPTAAAAGDPEGPLVGGKLIRGGILSGRLIGA